VNLVNEENSGYKLGNALVDVFVDNLTLFEIKKDFDFSSELRHFASIMSNSKNQIITLLISFRSLSVISVFLGFMS
jgi:hypothetical protein